MLNNTFRLPRLLILTICVSMLLIFSTFGTALADNPVCDNCPEDPNTFLTMLEKGVLEDSTTATAYYKAIDPDDKKTNFGDWLFETGFIANVVDYKTTGEFAVNTDTTIIHKNVADLGFVRLMRTRCEPSCDNPNPKIYSVIENYLNFEDAKARENRLASVAMEYTSPADGTEPNKRFVTYYAFLGAANGESDQRTLSSEMHAPFAPDLDGRGNKQVPSLCSSCHGGAGLNLDTNGSYKKKGDTGALFLPVDLDNFEFSATDSESPLSRFAQEAMYKKTNEIILITRQSEMKFDEDAGFSRLAAGSELIEGWYGGPGMPNDIFNEFEEFVPEGWLPPAAPAEAAKLYTEVIAPACRSCHAQQERSLDFGTYVGFMEFEDAHQELVLRVECGIDDDSSARGDGQDDQAVMPLAKETYKRFWDPATGPDPGNVSQADIFKEFIEEVECED